MFSDLIVSDSELVGRYESILNGEAPNQYGLILENGPGTLDDPVLYVNILGGTDENDNIGTINSGILRLTIQYTAASSPAQAQQWS